MSPEQRLDHLCAFLRASLPAFVAAENALHADAWAVPSGLVVVFGGKAPMPELDPNTAVLEAAIADETRQGLDLTQTDMDVQSTTVVRAWLMHVGDPSTGVEALYRKSLRLGSALRAAVLPIANDAFGDRSTVTRVRSALRVNPETDQREEFVSGSLHLFDVEGVDTLG